MSVSHFPSAAWVTAVRAWVILSGPVIVSPWRCLTCCAVAILSETIRRLSSSKLHAQLLAFSDLSYNKPADCGLEERLLDQPR